jgi:hypothetical protein
MAASDYAHDNPENSPCQEGGVHRWEADGLLPSKLTWILDIRFTDGVDRKRKSDLPNGHKCRVALGEEAGSFKLLSACCRRSKVDRMAAQSREALRSSSRQRLVLMAWRLCRWHRRR